MVQLSSASIGLLLSSAASVFAQNSICGSQIYTPGTGTCYDGTLCLYTTNPTTGQDNIITFLCGTQCYDAAKYTCQAGVLVAAPNGVASTAGASGVGAVSSTPVTETSGATAAPTPVVSTAVISSQSRDASSAAAAASSGSRVPLVPAFASGASSGRASGTAVSSGIKTLSTAVVTKSKTAAGAGAGVGSTSSAAAALSSTAAASSGDKMSVFNRQYMFAGVAVLASVFAGFMA